MYHIDLNAHLLRVGSSANHKTIQGRIGESNLRQNWEEWLVGKHSISQQNASGQFVMPKPNHIHLTHQLAVDAKAEFVIREFVQGTPNMSPSSSANDMINRIHILQERL